MASGTTIPEVQLFESLRQTLRTAFRTSNTELLQEIDPSVMQAAKNVLGEAFTEAVTTRAEISTDQLSKWLDTVNRKIDGIRQHQNLRRFR